MTYMYDAIDPITLTGYARAAQDDWERNQYLLAEFLPNRLVDDLEFRFTRGGGGLTEAANFRSFDTEAEITNRPTTARVTGQLPPMSRKIRFGEYDRLRQRNLTESIEQGVYDDVTRLVKMISARMELARGEALYTGQLAISENDIIATVDFGRAAAMEPAALTSTASWNDFANATPITNLMTWMEAFIDQNGEPPDVIVTSTLQLTNLMRNAEIRNMAAVGLSAATRVPRSALDAIFNDYGLPPIVTYDASINVAGTAQKVIPATHLLMMKRAQLGNTLYGTTAEALELEIVASEAPGIVATVMKDEDPVALWTKTAAIALPVLANPNLCLVADVDDET
jgi:hypothetical protein